MTQGKVVFDTAVIIAVLGMVAASLRPGFGGGHLVALVALFTAASLGWVMLREWTTAWNRGGKAPPHESLSDDAGRPGAAECWLAVIYALSMFALVFALGTLGGSVLFVGGFLLLHGRGRPWLAVMMALIVGVGVPYFLGGVLDARLWEGIIPEIVPGWIGGGIAPPL